jgi:hypothetical protein
MSCRGKNEIKDRGRDGRRKLSAKLKKMKRLSRQGVKSEGELRLKVNGSSKVNRLSTTGPDNSSYRNERKGMRY